MTERYSEFQRYRYAKQTAQKNNCFVVEIQTAKGSVFLLYRRGENKNECIGRRTTVAAIIKLVQTSCAIK